MCSTWGDICRILLPPCDRKSPNAVALAVMLRGELRPDQRRQFRSPMDGLNCCREHVRLADVFPRDLVSIHLRQVALECRMLDQGKDHYRSGETFWSRR
ncbi:hypothetical protein SBA3_4510004 [Candidatus Sulfopaludibacter sp. SbA3]|nr:hypothetical protein SBA3_4510004 [Candidatus Sulfopaludibacter sp. SbA3]